MQTVLIKPKERSARLRSDWMIQVHSHQVPTRCRTVVQALVTTTPWPFHVVRSQSLISNFVSLVRSQTPISWLAEPAARAPFYHSEYQPQHTNLRNLRLQPPACRKLLSLHFLLPVRKMTNLLARLSNFSHLHTLSLICVSVWNAPL